MPKKPRKKLEGPGSKEMDELFGGESREDIGTFLEGPTKETPAEGKLRAFVASAEKRGQTLREIEAELVKLRKTGVRERPNVPPKPLRPPLEAPPETETYKELVAKVTEEVREKLPHNQLLADILISQILQDKPFHLPLYAVKLTGKLKLLEESPAESESAEESLRRRHLTLIVKALDAILEK